MPRITLYGFYQYDNTLFDDIVLPEGIEKDKVIHEIIKDSGDLYPYHQVAGMLKANITDWFSQRQFDFGAMYRALRAEYNPIENYDRYEDITRDHQNSGSDKATTTLGSTTTSERNGSDTNTNQVSAYNAEDFTNREKDSRQTQDRVTNTGSGSDVATTEYGLKRKETEITHIHGNIGVTTAQQMITQEMEMRLKYDIYKVIAQAFEHEFIIQVY